MLKVESVPEPEWLHRTGSEPVLKPVSQSILPSPEPVADAVVGDEADYSSHLESVFESDEETTATPLLSADAVVDLMANRTTAEDLGRKANKISLGMGLVCTAEAIVLQHAVPSDK